jgi:hypothetical protein
MQYRSIPDCGELLEAEGEREALQKAERLYREGKWVLEPGSLLDVKFQVQEEGEKAD